MRFEDTFAYQAYMKRKAYRERVDAMPKQAVILRCSNGHEWRTQYTPPSDDTYPDYQLPWCPQCDEPWTSGRRPTTEEATPCTQ